MCNCPEKAQACFDKLRPNQQVMKVYEKFIKS